MIFFEKDNFFGGENCIFSFFSDILYALIYFNYYVLDI
jgi:hypothetical protein